MNIILFNGAPGSGKDTAAKIAEEYIKNTYSYDYWPLLEKFSYPHKRAFDVIFKGALGGLSHEHNKEKIIPIIGVSYRQWQIDFSEVFMRRLYGSNIFARLFLARCGVYNPNMCIPIVSDCGLQVEVDELRGHNCLLFRMLREGCTFENDSREYVEPAPGWKFQTVHNNSTISDLSGIVTRTVEEWIGETL
jgi:hypothetical protein